MSLLYNLALSFIPGVGPVNSRLLLDHFGSAAELFNSKKDELMLIPGIGEKIASNILSPVVMKRAEEEIRFIERYKIRTLFYSESDYPQRLRNCADAPILLYYKGSANLNSSRIVSIVGTRNATQYGRDLTEKLVEGLKPYDVLIISGLAYGIDGIAHRASVKCNIPNIGVVGHGLDRIYPSQHRSLAEKMIENGGLLTEFPSLTKPDKENFPMRNRIVAGMADATVVVEASESGGALITADLANSYDRDVFSFPGNIGQQFSAGCNNLIKTHRASLITDAKDLSYLLGWEEKEDMSSIQQLTLDFDVNPDEERIIHIVRSKQLGVDELSSETGIQQSQLAILLLELEMRGLIIISPGKLIKAR